MERKKMVINSMGCNSCCFGDAEEKDNFKKNLLDN